MISEVNIYNYLGYCYIW